MTWVVTKWVSRIPPVCPCQPINQIRFGIFLVNSLRSSYIILRFVVSNHQHTKHWDFKGEYSSTSREGRGVGDSDSRFPQVAPEKDVWEQSQTYLFQPSVQVPPCMQGWSWQCPGILWHEDRIDPAEWEGVSRGSMFV